MEHVLDEHTTDGENSGGNSVFDDGVDIRGLIGDAADYPAQVPPNGRYYRNVPAGRVIGVDRDGLPVTNYTVVTTEDGDLWTAYPGNVY